MPDTEFSFVNIDFSNVARILNLPDGIDPQHPATVAQLEALSAGIAWKDAARVATQGNINLSAPGADIDGVTLALDDRVLVIAQTDPAENGIYVFNGAGVPMTRAPDAATFDAMEAAVITVEEGTAQGGTTWRQTAINGALGTDPVVFAAFGTSVPAATDTSAGIVELATQAEVDAGTDTTRAVTPATLANAAGIPRAYTTMFGDGTSTSYTITHNLDTFAVTAQVFRATGTRDLVNIGIERTTANTVTVVSAIPIGVDALEIVVHG